MKIIIAGSRTISDYNIVTSAVKASNFVPSIIVSGGARGTDKLGERYGQDNNILVEVFPANWAKYGKRAGRIRNNEMAEFADALIAIWDGSSPGTKHMMNEMKKLDKPVFVYKINVNV